MAEADWKFKAKKLKNGLTVSFLSEKSTNTHTAVRLTAPLIDQELRRASVIIRACPNINVTQLREELPLLSQHASDSHLVELIDAGGTTAPREFTNRMIEAATAGHPLSAETIAWYRSHDQRQIKSRRGRPRKK